MPQVDRSLWGALEVEGLPETEEYGRDAEELEGEDDEASEDHYAIGGQYPEASAHGKPQIDIGGYATPSGLSSIESGLETPEYIELRKQTKR